MTLASAVRLLEHLLTMVQQYQQKLRYYGWTARRQPNSKLHELIRYLGQLYFLKILALAELLRKLDARSVGMSSGSENEFSGDPQTTLAAEK